MKVKTPLHDGVLVRFINEETESKILVKRERNTAKVLDIGADVEVKQKEHRRPMQVGDTVFLPRGDKIGDRFGDDVMLVPFHYIACVVS